MSIIRHVGFYINELYLSINFFIDLGFKICYLANEDWGEDLGKLLIVKMKDNLGNVIELINNSNKCIPDNSHLSLTVENLDNISKNLKSKGVEFIVNPRLSPNKSVRLAFCKDPNGIIIELVQKED